MICCMKYTTRESKPWHKLDDIYDMNTSKLIENWMRSMRTFSARKTWECTYCLIRGFLQKTIDAWQIGCMRLNGDGLPTNSMQHTGKSTRKLMWSISEFWLMDFMIEHFFRMDAGCGFKRAVQADADMHIKCNSPEHEVLE